MCSELFEPHVLPASCRRRSRLVDAVAVADAALAVVLAGADPDDARVLRVDRDAADRVGALAVEDRRPGGAGVRRSSRRRPRRRPRTSALVGRIDGDVADAAATSPPARCRAASGRTRCRRTRGPWACPPLSCRLPSVGFLLVGFFLVGGFLVGGLLGVRLGRGLSAGAASRPGPSRPPASPRPAAWPAAGRPSGEWRQTRGQAQARSSSSRSAPIRMIRPHGPNSDHGPRPPANAARRRQLRPDRAHGHGAVVAQLRLDRVHGPRPSMLPRSHG